MSKGSSRPVAAAGILVCKACHKSCSNQTYVSTSTSDFYHAECLSCHHCHKPIASSAGQTADRRQQQEYSFTVDDNLPYHTACMEGMLQAKAIKANKVCQSCKQPCYVGNIIHVSASEMYHGNCFKCKHCNKPISDSKYTKYGPSMAPHHPKCVDELSKAKAVAEKKVCQSCKQPCFVGNIIQVSASEMYHGNCFKCGHCNRLITDGKYAKHGATMSPHHPACVEALSKAQAIAEKKICKSCRLPCYVGSYVETADHELYHQSCFLCTKCHMQLDRVYAVHPTSKMPYHQHCLEDTAAAAAMGSSPILKGRSTTLCRRCRLPCEQGRVLTTANGDMFHADCFQCDHCQRIMTATYHKDRKDAMKHCCDVCFKALYSLKCRVCECDITGSYVKHPYFDEEVYCGTIHEKRLSCFACGRKEPLKSSLGFIDLCDGRHVCEHCTRTMVVDSPDAEAIYREVIAFMQNQLTLTIPKQMHHVPVVLLDQPSLLLNRSKFSKNKSTLGHHGSGETIDEECIRGVTLCSCTEEVQYTTAGICSETTSSRAASKGRLRQSQLRLKVSQKREVSAVLALYGLPHALISSILAHEAMHVWLKLNKKIPFIMSPKLEEGLCQAIAYLYTQHLSTDTKYSDVKAIRSDVKERKSFAGYVLHQIAANSSTVYGEGFREVWRAVATAGLTGVVNYVEKHNRLPISK